MHVEKVVAGASPSPRVRRLVSVIIAGHCIAILLAVTSYSTPHFPAPQLAVRASGPLQPYLQATFLNNAYRFFAPNPGVPTVFWFRVQYGDGCVRWVELPGKSAGPVRAPYQRQLNLAVQLGQYLALTPAEDGRKTIAPLGAALLQSAVRHVATDYPRQGADGNPVAIQSVGVYSLLHVPLMPAQVRAGWMPTDLRTYRATFLGAYSAHGDRVDEFRPHGVDQPNEYVTTGIIELDAAPRVSERPGSDPLQTLANLHLPEPIHDFLVRHPEVLVMAGPERKERIASLLAHRPGEVP